MAARLITVRAAMAVSAGAGAPKVAVVPKHARPSVARAAPARIVPSFSPLAANVQSVVAVAMNVRASARRVQPMRVLHRSALITPAATGPGRIARAVMNGRAAKGPLMPVTNVRRHPAQIGPIAKVVAVRRIGGARAMALEPVKGSEADQARGAMVSARFGARHARKTKAVGTP